MTKHKNNNWTGWPLDDSPHRHHGCSQQQCLIILTIAGILVFSLGILAGLWQPSLYHYIGQWLGLAGGNYS